MQPIQGMSHELSRLEPGFALNYSYPVIFTRDVFGPGNDCLRSVCGSSGVAGPVRSQALLFIIDEGLLRARPDLQTAIQDYCAAHPNLQCAGPPLILPGGEACKNDLSHLTRIYEAVAHRGIDRHSYIVAVGGGALIDLAGFAASTAHRGIRLIRIPTTVLAQNDASVGVKNGMNFAGRKNFIGTFAPPHAVINDFGMLGTLSHRDLRSGMAEAIKVALIRDAAFFRWLEAHAGQLARFETWTLEHLIQRCAELHLEQISRGGDPFESGSARPLDFGHWMAHKLEEISGHELRHGEAVALGMAVDTVYSMLSGLLEREKAARVLHLLGNLGFSVFSSYLPRVEIPSALEEFREHLGGPLCITLLEDLGRGLEVNQMHASLVERCIAILEDFAEGKALPRSIVSASASLQNGYSAKSLAETGDPVSLSGDSQEAIGDPVSLSEDTQRQRADPPFILEDPNIS